MLKLLLGDVDLLSGGLEHAAEYLARAVELRQEACAPFSQALSMERMAAVAIARGQRWRADPSCSGRFAWHRPAVSRHICSCASTTR